MEERGMFYYPPPFRRGSDTIGEVCAAERWPHADVERRVDLLICGVVALISMGMVFSIF